MMFNFVFYWHKLQGDVSIYYRGTAVTVATASVPDAAPSKCWDHAWAQQVRRGTEEKLHQSDILFLDRLLKFYDRCIMSHHNILLLSPLLVCALSSDLVLLLFLLQLRRPRERLCLFVLPVIPLSSSYNEVAGRFSVLVASRRSFTVRPRGQLQVTETLTHALVFKLSTSVCQDTSRVEHQEPPISLPVASLLSYSRFLWDFYYNVLNISCFNSQWRTGPYESMRLSTEHNGSKIKGPFPFAVQREVQSMQGRGWDPARAVGWYK